MSENKHSLVALIGSLFGVIAVAVVGLAIGWVVRGMMPEKPKEPSAQMVAMQKMAAMPISVSVLPPAMRPYSDPRSYPAHAEAVAEVQLMPQVDGYIEEVCFKEGDLVTQGSILYKLNNERYRAVLNQRLADLEKAEAECRRAELYHERMQKADPRSVTALERDNAETGALSARASVAQAKANLAIAQYDLDHAVIVAPISGQIGKTLAHVGDYVAPSKGSLAKIVQLDPIRVTFPMNEREYAQLQAGIKAGTAKERTFRLLLPGATIDKFYDGVGVWDFGDNSMSRETASVGLRISFPNPNRILLPNSNVKLVMDDKDAEMKPHVPAQAIVELGGGKRMVWVLDATGSVAPREIVTGAAFAGWVPVLQGLEPDASVVISGMQKLKPGVKVMPVPPTDNEDLNPNFVSRFEERK